MLWSIGVWGSSTAGYGFWSASIRIMHSDELFVMETPDFGSRNNCNIYGNLGLKIKNKQKI